MEERDYNDYFYEELQLVKDKELMIAYAKGENNIFDNVLLNIRDKKFALQLIRMKPKICNHLEDFLLEDIDIISESFKYFIQPFSWNVNDSDDDNIMKKQLMEMYNNSMLNFSLSRLIRNKKNLKIVTSKKSNYFTLLSYIPHQNRLDRKFMIPFCVRYNNEIRTNYGELVVKRKVENLIK